METNSEIVAEYKGMPITKDLVDEWADAYESGRIPSGYTPDGPAQVGRPPLFDGEVTTLTVRIPVVQKEALTREAEERGMTLSGYVRELLALRSA